MHSQVKRNRSPDPAVLAEIVRRLVDVMQPDSIILFGSAARGEMGTDSDLDLLVIKSGSFDQGGITGKAYTALIGVGQAVDLIVLTPEEIKRFRDNPYLVVASALA